ADGDVAGHVLEAGAVGGGAGGGGRLALAAPQDDHAQAGLDRGETLDQAQDVALDARDLPPEVTCIEDDGHALPTVMARRIPVSKSLRSLAGTPRGLHHNRPGPAWKQPRHGGSGPLSPDPPWRGQERSAV